MSLDELIDAYWEQWRLRTSRERTDRLHADDVFWAYEVVEAFIRNRPIEAWYYTPERTPDLGGVDRLDFIVRLLERAPDSDDAMAYAGAGPVESYIQVWRDVDRVEAMAQTNARFRTALRCALYDRYVSPEDAARLRRLGDPL